MDAIQLANNFASHPGTSKTIPMHEEVRLLCGTLAQDLNELLPEGRHKSIVMTKLEEVAQMAHASIAINLSPAQASDEDDELNAMAPVART